MEFLRRHLPVLAQPAQDSWNGGMRGYDSFEAHVTSLPPVIGVPISRARSGIAARPLRRGGGASRCLYIGPKTQIIVNGRIRVPEGLTKPC